MYCMLQPCTHLQRLENCRNRRVDVVLVILVEGLYVTSITVAVRDDMDHQSFATRATDPAEACKECAKDVNLHRT